MGRKSNAKKKRGGNHSKLSDHHREGKVLIPPFQKIDKLKKLSWSNDRLPEYIWIGLIVSLKGREESLEIIRRVCKFFSDLKEEHRPLDLSLSSLSKLKPEILERFLDLLFKDLDNSDSLNPLGLFDQLPGKEMWLKYINIKSSVREWEKLFYTVARCLDHHSQEATDCRWARILFYLVCNKFGMPKDMAEQIIYYPNVGDMRSVRPTIRSCELSLNILPDFTAIKTDWPKLFWDQGLRDTSCWGLNMNQVQENSFSLDVNNYEEVMRSLKDHFYEKNENTDINAKFDSVFGLSIYCLEIFGEMISNNNSTSILSRIGLRTITECFITLSYLCDKDDVGIWKMYRMYGSGQAKLSFLKLDDLETKPKYIDTDTLKTLAGEDQWDEFVEINLGHWENTNLRKMSETAGVKDDYNAYYDWTSGFAHGQWAAVRNTVYNTCGNPMHRLHRILKEEKLKFNDVTEDAKALCNKVLDLVNKMYPTFTSRLI